MKPALRPERTDAEERAYRWRLLLGEPAEPALTELAGGLDSEGERMDAALGALYEPAERSGGLGTSAPRTARWLGDIRRYFPASVVQVMQRDAVDRLGLASMLLEPELLEAVQPDVHLVATLISLGGVLPETTKATARQVVATVVAEIHERLANRTVTAVAGAVRRSTRTRRPRPRDIDWDATIRRNLRTYLPEHKTVVPERLVGASRGSSAVAKEVVVAIDESGSMAESMVYAAILAATLASLRTLRTSVVAFDTEVADLSALLDDPVELLFGCRLGGGTDLNRAVRYCAQLITRPQDSILILISDLFDGGAPGEFQARVRDLVASGVTVIVLLALSDAGAPAYDHEVAADLAALGVTAFGCTPDRFPDLLATAIVGGDLAGWVSGTVGGSSP